MRPQRSPPATLFAVLLSLCLSSTAVRGIALPKRAQPLLSEDLLSLVKARAVETSNDTWVSGTLTEALLELDYPDLTVFNPNIFPLPDSSIEVSSYPTETNAIIDNWYSKRPSWTREFAYVAGGASADPAALGYAWIIAASTEASESTRSTYETIVQDELAYLKSVPTTSDGAMSMRPPSESVQLWADFIYMVPPFFAARGLQTNDSSLLLEAYDQIQTYRKYLRDSNTKLWKHVLLGSWQDTKLWGTGNAWAAAGMMRVLASMLFAPNAYMFAAQIEALSSWISEIVGAAFARLDNNGMVPNYFLASSFSDTAATALLASVPLRLAQLGLGNSTQVATAITLRDNVISRIDTTTGWVQGCVDPLSWLKQTNQSPEAQSFVLLLEAAYRGYLDSAAATEVATRR